MELIIATEIWGRTPYVDALAHELGAECDKVTVLDPYDGSLRYFTSEQQAYSAYIEQCGHAAYAHRVRDALAGAQKCFLLGFSAGAGAVWSALCDGKRDNIAGALCFYGSSIRDMVSTTSASVLPEITELIFPQHEPHFNVQELVATLRSRVGVTCHTVSMGHGFMNPLSQNYDAQGCRVWTEYIRNQLRSVGATGRD